MFAQITPKVLRHLGFFRNREKFEIRHFIWQPLPKMAENCAFSFARTDPRDDIYQFSLRSG